MADAKLQCSRGETCHLRVSRILRSVHVPFPLLRLGASSFRERLQRIVVKLRYQRYPFSGHANPGASSFLPRPPTRSRLLVIVG